MNTRGEQLEPHEIAKARIIEAIASDENKSGDSKDEEIAVKIWDACAQMDRYVQMCFSTTERDKIFGDNWDSFNANNFEELKLKYKYANENPNQNSDREQKNTKTLKEILNKDKLTGSQEDTGGKKEDEDDNVRFESIITFPNFLLQVNKVLQNKNDDDSSLDDKDFLNQLGDRWSSKEKALEFVYSMIDT